jgi:hypothetical protein
MGGADQGQRRNRRLKRGLQIRQSLQRAPRLSEAAEWRYR